jgi:hypothetical protein
MLGNNEEVGGEKTVRQHKLSQLVSVQRSTQTQVEGGHLHYCLMLCVPVQHQEAI